MRLPDAIQQVLDKPFTGDFDEMVKRRSIRVGVTYNRTHYFIDKGQERGLTYESLKSFEEELNKELKTGNLRVHVVPVIMRRDRLAPALLEGKVDMVAAMVTVRPESRRGRCGLGADANQRQRGGGDRARRAVDRRVDDLSGQEVFIRRTSPYFETRRAQRRLKARGKAPV